MTAVTASPLGRLRARYAALDERPEQTLKLAVTYGVSDGKDGRVGMLVEYRLPDVLQVQEIKKRWVASKHPKWELYAAAEQLAAACVDVWARDDDNGEEIPGFAGRWSPGLGEGGGRVTFNRAAELLGRPVDMTADHPGLQAVMAVLREEWQVTDHDELLGRWEPGPPQEVADRFVGEPSAIPSGEPGLTGSPAGS